MYYNAQFEMFIFSVKRYKHSFSSTYFPNKTANTQHIYIYIFKEKEITGNPEKIK